MKSKFSNCNQCPLKDQKIIVGETNCTNLSDVKLLVIADAPMNNEIKSGRPLIGNIGKIYRNVAEQVELNKIPHFITNVCLCANIQNGKTEISPKEAVKCCRPNLDNLIDTIKPELILGMGSIPKERFGIDNKLSMTKARGKIFQYHGLKDSYIHFLDYDILLTWHPQYLECNGGLTSDRGKEFISDLKLACITAMGTQRSSFEDTIKDIIEPHYFKYPEWMLQDDVCCMDIQRFTDRGEVAFIFREKNGEKKYHVIRDSEYYFYNNGNEFSTSPMLESIDNVEVVLGEPNNEKYYESDIRTELKHSIDYYYQRQKNDIPEIDIPLKVMYFDIEVYNENRKEFPDPKKALRPINAISFKFNDKEVNIWIANVQNKMQQIELNIPNVKYFKDERLLLVAFCKMVVEENPDLMVGWNCNAFDFPYIFGRLKKNQIPLKSISPMGKAFANTRRFKDFYIGGIHCLDQLDLYKELTYSVEESYSLNAIATKVLGKQKVAYVGSLDHIYETDIEKFIEYSGVDTDLLYDLDVKLGHIELKNELRKICSSTWKVSETTMGLIDPLVVSYAKNSNLVCRAAANISTDKTIKGAYVRYPTPGLHSWLVDFDYTSLYPSIICSCNIGPNTLVARIKDDDMIQYIYGQQDRIQDMLDIVYDPIQNPQKKKISTDEFCLWIGKNKYIVTVSGCIYKSHNEEISFFYKILRYILESRSDYKDMKKAAKTNKDPKAKMYHNIQMAYKILANSLYGVLANTGFRFFNHDLARTVTLTGQESIKFIGQHVGTYMEKETTEVDPYFMDDYEDKKIPYLLYTDTDSIFLQMGDWLQQKNMI